MPVDLATRCAPGNQPIREFFARRRKLVNYLDQCTVEEVEYSRDYSVAWWQLIAHSSNGTNVYRQLTKAIGGTYIIGNLECHSNLPVRLCSLVRIGTLSQYSVPLQSRPRTTVLALASTIVSQAEMTRIKTLEYSVIFSVVVKFIGSICSIRGLDHSLLPA